MPLRQLVANACIYVVCACMLHDDDTNDDANACIYVVCACILYARHAGTCETQSPVAVATWDWQSRAFIGACLF